MSSQVETVKGPNPLMKALRNKRVLNAISIIGFLLIWDLAVQSGLLSIMPRPHEVLLRWIELMHEPYAGHTLPIHVWISFRRVIIAFLLAAAIGIPTGVIMAFSKFAHAVIRPIFEFFKPMPPIAWISLSILWFGLGEPSKVFLIFIGCVVPCILNSYNGIRLVDPELYDAVRNLGANYWQEQTQVTFPASLPAIFAGLQVALSSGWTCVVAAELVGAREGIGYLTFVGMKQDDIAMTIGGILTICLVSFLSSLFLTYLERWLCPWKRNISE